MKWSFWLINWPPDLNCLDSFVTCGHCHIRSKKKRLPAKALTPSLALSTARRQRKEAYMPLPLKVKMEVSPFIVDPAMPSDPALRAVADDVLAKLRRSFTAVAAEEQPGAHGSADDMFRAFLATRGAPTRTRYREQSQGLLNSPSSLQTAYFGRYAAVNSKAYQSVGSDDLPSL